MSGILHVFFRNKNPCKDFYSFYFGNNRCISLSDCLDNTCFCYCCNFLISRWPAYFNTLFLKTKLDTFPFFQRSFLIFQCWFHNCYLTSICSLLGIFKGYCTFSCSCYRNRTIFFYLGNLCIWTWGSFDHITLYRKLPGRIRCSPYKF